MILAIGLCGALLFVAGVLHVPITPVTAAVAAVIAMVAGSRGRGVARSSSPATSRPRDFAADVLLLLPILVVTYAATVIPLHDFDGRAFWLLKAKGIAHDHSITGPFFHDEEVVDPRNDYPLLVPLDAATIMMVSGSLDDRHVRLFYVFTFAALVLLIRERLGGWWAVLVAWIPQFAVAPEGGALSAYCDIALAAFVAGAFFELVDDESPLRFGLFISFAALTKNEGLPLALVLLAAGAFVFRRRLWRAAIPFAIALTSLLWWKRGIPHGGEEDLAALALTLPHQLHRLGGALAGFAMHLVSPMWGAFWIAALIALILGRNKLAGFVIGGAFATYIAAYTVTTWVQIDLINSSADRLLMHVVGPGVFAISAFARSRYSPLPR